MNGRSQWRMDDAAVHALMRETLLELRSTLLKGSRHAGETQTALHDEIRALHRAFGSVDGFDRRAVNDFATALEARLREVNGERS